MSQTLALPAPFARIRSYVELGKPRLSLLVIFTAAAGMWLSPGTIGLGEAVVFLASTCLLVAAANTLNCWIEVEIDALMHRTRTRPLQTGRLAPRQALGSGLVLIFVSLSGLLLATNALTTGLGALALVSYVLVYTPLKRLTPMALFVGAVPGALPPLMGWTAATGSLGAPGWLLFGILFCWQLPHFLAIAIYLKEDFRRGGIRVLPLVRGNAVARQRLILYTVLLSAVSLLGQPLGIAGTAYTVTAALLAVGFLTVAARGFHAASLDRWARGVFGYSLIYLPTLITALVLA